MYFRIVRNFLTKKPESKINKSQKISLKRESFDFEIIYYERKFFFLCWARTGLTKKHDIRLKPIFFRYGAFATETHGALYK